MLSMEDLPQILLKRRKRLSVSPAHLKQVNVILVTIPVGARPAPEFDRLILNR
jgi:hypothetical protein